MGAAVEPHARRCPFPDDQQRRGRRTRARHSPARSGRPPRETTAATVRSRGRGDEGGGRAGAGAEQPTGSFPRLGGDLRRLLGCSQSMAPTTRSASSAMSNRRSRGAAGRCASSSGVSRSTSSVPKPGLVQRVGDVCDCVGCAGCCRCRARTRPSPAAIAAGRRSPSSRHEAIRDSGRRPASRAPPRHPERVRLGHLAGLPLAVRSSGSTARVSSMWITARTVRQPGVEVVALPLGLRAVDDADRPLQPGRAQRIGSRRAHRARA